MAFRHDIPSIILAAWVRLSLDYCTSIDRQSWWRWWVVHYWSGCPFVSLVARFGLLGSHDLLQFEECATISHQMIWNSLPINIGVMLMTRSVQDILGWLIVVSQRSWPEGFAGWYVSNVSIIFDAPCLFLHHLPNVSLHIVALLCIFQN
jgi:hypothetical protein